MIYFRLFYTSILISTCILLSTGQNLLFSQHTIAFTQVENSAAGFRSKENLITANLYSIPKEALKSLGSTRDESVRFQFDNDLDLTVNLYTSEILAEHYVTHISMTDSEIIEAKFTEDILSFKGNIKTNPASRVVLTLSVNGLEGYISNGEKEYYIESSGESPDGKLQYLSMYTPDDIQNKTINCLFTESDKLIRATANYEASTDRECKEIELAIAADYIYFQNYNYDVSAVIARTLTVMNLVEDDYASVFQDSISFKIVEHFISTCADCDRWGENQDAIVKLERFRYWAEDGGFSQQFDLGQLWTGGDLQQDQISNTIGYAFKAGICTDKRYHILEDYSESLWKLRLLATHEIGHNLDCSHDPAGSNTIMSPTASNTNSWSEASISSINTFVADIDCLENCSMTHCDPIDNFIVDEFSSTLLSASWSSQFPVHLIIRNQLNGEILHETITNENSLDLSYDFSSCTSIVVELIVNCSGTDSIKTTISLGQPIDLFINILDIQSANCVPGLPSTYELEMVIEHNGDHNNQFFVDINGQTSQFLFGPSPQMITIDKALIPSNVTDYHVSVFSIIDSKIYCLSEIDFDEIPNRDCDLSVIERFDSCTLPYGWTKATSNTQYFPFPYDWQFDDDSRKVLNYGKSENAFRDKTIDGSCMAYFDDDINSSTAFTGSLILYTDIYDLMAFDNLQLNFVYLFHDFSDIKGSNDSFFSMQVWNGSHWIEVLRDDDSPCPWSDVWEAECIDVFSLSLDQYKNSQFQCRFIYSDSNEGDWTGMAALDNFNITGDRNNVWGCTDENSINYNPLANVDNESCFSCHDGIQNGTETGVDCGGQNCDPCIATCSTEHVRIVDISKDSIYTNANQISISTDINAHQIELKPAKTSVMGIGFEVKVGSTFSVDITPCFELNN